tara:strand:+ start:3683 stop:3850 length:168 start_codon:yes stop_codon:yes gene_type:complete
MKYKITRLDGKEDKLTTIIYESYDDAHKALEINFGELCCSDVDYDDFPGYDIIKI